MPQKDARHEWPPVGRAAELGSFGQELSSSPMKPDHRHHPLRSGALALFILASLIPPTMFFGLVGKSDWTTSETHEFLVIVSGSSAMGLLGGWFVSSASSWRWLAALASPAVATLAWLLIGLTYELWRGEFPMSRLIDSIGVYSFSILMLSTPAAGLFAIMQLWRGRNRVADHFTQNP